MESIKDNIKGNIENVKEKIEANIPYSANKYISGSKEFLSSNSLIAKSTFLIFVVIIFVLLFILGTKIIKMIIEPPDNPYLIKGMVSNQSMTISQNLSNPNSKLIKRSTKEYNGIEFTYSTWLFINEISSLTDYTYTHVFSKGSKLDMSNGILQPNNCPGFYLFKGEHEPSRDNLFNTSDEEKIYSGLVIVNVYNKQNNNFNKDGNYHEERVYVRGIPVKKWVNIIIRTNSQNLLDVYINGVLNKRHKLSNVIKQNYDDIQINIGNKFDGYISNLRYYNHAIGTFEIDKIIKQGPNLTTKSGDLININNNYLSSDWFYRQENTDFISD